MATKAINPKVVAGTVAALPAAPFAAWLVSRIPESILPADLQSFAVGVVAAAIVFAVAWLKSEFPAVATFFDKNETEDEPDLSVQSGAQLAAAAAEPVVVDASTEDEPVFVDAEAEPTPVA